MKIWFPGLGPASHQRSAAIKVVSILGIGASGPDFPNLGGVKYSFENPSKCVRWDGLEAEIEKFKIKPPGGTRPAAHYRAPLFSHRESGRIPEGIWKRFWGILPDSCQNPP